MASPASVLARLAQHSRKAQPTMAVNPSALDLHALGQQYGVPNLGPLTPPREVAPGVNIPGGLEGEFTYEDLLYIKANPFDRASLPLDQKTQLQKKLLQATSPADAADDVDTFNRYVFGMLSPNQPLTPNEMEAAVVRARTPGDIDWWASQAPGSRAPKCL